MAGEDNKEMKSLVPSELKMTKNWDWAVGEFGSKVAYGTFAAGMLAVVVVGSHPRLRFGLTTFGSGFGAGWAYKNVNDVFEKTSRGQ